MQFAVKLVTLLTLVTLFSAALGQPVANEQASGKSILEKRRNNWRWGRAIRRLANAGWGVDGLQIGRWGNDAVVFRDGQWWNLPRNMWPNDFGFNSLPDFSGFPSGRPFFSQNGFDFFGDRANPFWRNSRGHRGRLNHPVDQFMFF
ncbi:hypothetical protein DFH28DRAFT_982784 [Melampsora americana]|nr:hypothetical protein DFH28DRAFT_982784 [Melampsora americana]